MDEQTNWTEECSTELINKYIEEKNKLLIELKDGKTITFIDDSNCVFEKWECENDKFLRSNPYLNKSVASKEELLDVLDHITLPFGSEVEYTIYLDGKQYENELILQGEKIGKLYFANFHKNDLQNENQFKRKETELEM